MAERKPWDDPSLVPEDAKELRRKTRRMKRRKKKVQAPAKTTPGAGGIAEDIGKQVDALKKRNKKLAPYKDTGPGAKKKKRG